MPKRKTNRKYSNNKKGGFWGEGFWGEDYLKKAKGLNPFAKEETEMVTNNYVAPSVAPPTESVAPPTTVNSVPDSSVPVMNNPTNSIGGRRKTRRRRYSKKQKGGVHSNETSSQLALNAAPFSGKTAEAQIMLGGKTRKRRKNKRRSKSHKKRRH